MKIDTTKMEVVIKWLVATNVFEVMNFVGVASYLMKFKALCSVVATPLHAITMSDMIF